jgi:hypothetical protein
MEHCKQQNPAFFTVNARQFWLRRTLLKFEERAAEFPPNLGKTSEGLIDQSNLNLSKTRSLRFDRSPAVLSREVVEGKQRVAILDRQLDSLVIFDAEVEEELFRRLRALAHAVDEPDKFLFAFGRGADDHQQAKSSTKIGCALRLHRRGHARARTAPRLHRCRS